MSNNDLQMLMGGGENLLLRRRMMMQKKNEPMPKANEIWYEAEEQVTLSDSTWVIGHTFNGGRGVVTFDRDLTAVSYRWFYKTRVTRIYLPNQITGITAYAFRECPILNKINLPNALTSVGEFAFYMCSELIITILPSSVNSLEWGCFGYCQSIPSITIPIITPPSAGQDIFYRTGSTPIYVPAESVDTYKATDGWSTYADRIFAIPE